MNFHDIQIVSKYLPIIEPAMVGTAPKRQKDFSECPFEEAEMTKFLRCYNEFDFAWKAASLLAKHNCILPIFPHGSDKWFYRAWLLLKDPKAHTGNESYNPIREAWIYEHKPEQRPTRELLRALLITRGATVARVADVLNLEVEVVEAFECLFFNVIARHKDSLYIRNLVYPETKMEEMTANYFERANLGNVLLRLGYNHTIEDVLYFSGMRLVSYREGITEAQAMADYQHKTMANGLILASVGFLNYATPVSGLVAAKGLASAARIGGGETGGGNDDGLGDFVGSARVVLMHKKKIVEDSLTPVYG